MTPPVPPGFDYRRVDVAGVTINCAVAGSGPPPLLLHGYPQNHLAWRQVPPPAWPGTTPSWRLTCAATETRPSPSRTKQAACTPMSSAMSIWHLADLARWQAD